MKAIRFGVIGLAMFAGHASTAVAASANQVLTHYSDIAHAVYEDSLISAKDLQKALNNLVKNPNETTLQQAKEAWRAARVPYQQSEAYRFGNAIVDDWEGRVNAWPLDEGLIDYVDASYGEDSDENGFYTANVIANTVLKVEGKSLDASNISPKLISESLHEVGGIEANVASGYHAIEFLLWGQDLNGTGPGAGERPATDFNVKNCSNGHCDRRVAYLQATSALLISDLEEMTASWAQGGEARKAVLDAGPQQGLANIIKGLGSLSYGELAGERMKLGLMLHDPEEEHDCFSDNTHWSHYYDAKGIQNVYLGKYQRIDGRTLKGPSLADLIARKDKTLANRIEKDVDSTMAKMQAIVDSANNGMSYDQMLAVGNSEGFELVQGAINALVAQAKSFEQASAKLGLNNVEFEGSDSLDSPEKVY